MAAAASNDQWKMVRHLSVIDEEISLLVRRQVPERVLVIRMPPRHGKSELVSHWTPTWHKANWPEKNVLFASYESTFAESWGRKARDSFSNVVALAPDVLIGRLNLDMASVGRWGTTAGGYMASVGVGGPATGMGFHLGICDDLIKNAEQAQSEIYRNKTWEWFTSTFWSRREPDGVLVVVGTPWHRDDYLARLRDWNEPIREICLPAICEHEDDFIGREVGEALWPARYDETALESIRLAQGPYYWNALYQQRPSTHEHAEWPEHYFADHIWATDFRGPFEFSIIAIDPAQGANPKRGDYSAVVFIGYKSGKLWVDCWIDRKSIPETVSQVIEKYYYEWGADIVAVEGNGFQKLALGPEFEKQCTEKGLPPLPIMFHENMEGGGKHKPRISRLGSYFSRNQIVFNNNRHCRLLVNMLKDYPLGDHDDGPDAMEMGVRELVRYITSLREPPGDRAETLVPV
jgi:predicted phage terminase large subunit-like protein